MSYRDELRPAYTGSDLYEWGTMDGGVLAAPAWKPGDRLRASAPLRPLETQVGRARIHREPGQPSKGAGG
jgi:hypothetical protein